MTTGLICQRLSETRVHDPNEIIRFCVKCGENVAIFPSGQRVLAQHPDAEIVCTYCVPPDASMEPAPGAIEEARRHLKNG